MSIKLPKNSWLRDPWFWGLALAGALLLLVNLESSGLLWQDEAETAVLAKNTLRFGYPKVFDGINRVNPGLVMGPFESWAYHPWLQFYVTAVSFLFFGATTAAARLPFAIAGVLSILLSYRLAKMIFQSASAARLLSLLMLTSVPLLLHFRQSRYYALATLATLAAVWAYFKAREGKVWAWRWLAGALIVLFHSHHGAFLPTAVAIALDLWKRGIPTPARRQAWVWLGIAALLTLPWLFILNVGQHQGSFSGREIRHHAQFYFRQIHHYIFPVFFLLAAASLRQIHPIAWWRQCSDPQRQRWELIGWILVANLAFIVAVPWQRHFRYLIHLIPLFGLIQAGFLWAWLGKRPAVLIGVTVLLTCTDLLHYSTPYVVAQQVPRLRAKIEREHGLVHPESLFSEYLYELTHRYNGPLGGIIGQLQHQAKPSDTVKIPYDDHAVIFYTGLKVEDLNRFTHPTFPDWIIPRKDWVPGDFYLGDYFRQIERDYEKIETDAPDIVWENRPDPGYHKFRTVDNAPRVVLYHRKQSTKN